MYDEVPCTSVLLTAFFGGTGRHNIRIMENLKLFVFSTDIKGVPKRISFNLPTTSSFVITNQYRPNLYSETALPIVNMQAGEDIKDFYNDCNNILTAASCSSQEGVDALVDGLIAVIKAHIAKCGRLIFGDLMIYIDCWAHILKGGGVSDQDVKDYYSVELGILVSGFLPHIKDDSTLAPFSGTRTFIAVKQHVNEVAIRLNGKPFF